MKKLFYFILLLSINVNASWIFFYSPDCPHCEELLIALDNQATNQIVRLNLEYPTNYHRFLLEAESRGETNAWPRKLPVLMTDSLILRGNEKIVAFLSGATNYVNNSSKENYSSFNNSTGKTKLKMFAVGLIDGINPCAFALMIFVCAALRLAGRRNKALFLGAIVFISAVAATYLALGWGLLHGLRASMTTPLVRAIVYATFSVLTLAAAVFALINIYKNHVTAGVPEKWRRWLQRNIRKNVRFGTGLIVIAAMGVVAAAVESVCTGQVYLPALLMLEREQGKTFAAFCSLILYNVGFIIPLALVAIGAVFGLKAAQLERWGTKQMRWANGILCLLFLSFSVLLFWWSFQEYSRIKKRNYKQTQIQNNSKVGLSRTNAEIFVRKAIGLFENPPILCQTDSGDLYWLFKEFGVTVDFWKPVLVTCPADKELPVKEFSLLENANDKYKSINNEILKSRHSEYVGAIAWWISYQQKYGDPAYKSIPQNNLYELIDKACGSCGEATGFSLITSRFGFNSHASSKSIGLLGNKSLPSVVTWNSEGQQHAAVILEKIGKGIWLQARFLENSEVVFMKAHIPEQAKIWVLDIGK